LQSPTLGNKAYPDDLLNLNSFGELYQWCVDKEFTCNGVITGEKRLDELLSAVLGTSRAMMIMNGNKYGILIDKPRYNPVTILNSQNVLNASNQKNFADLPDGFCVNFINEGDGYEQNELYAMKDGSNIPLDGQVIETIDMPFITNHRQVTKNALYQLACRYLRPEIWNRKVSIDGYLIAIGDRVEVQDDTILIGIGEGAEIKEIISGSTGITAIVTDGLFDVTDLTKIYGVKIAQYDGVNNPAIRTKQVDITESKAYNRFEFSEPISSTDPLRPSIGDFISFGILDRITTSALCFGKKDNGDGTFDLTLVPYQEGIYTADSGYIPDFDSKITPPQKLAGITSVPPDVVSREEAVVIANVMGKVGPPAVIYQVVPSVSVVKVLDNGLIIPSTITCDQQSITGDGSPETSDKTLKYVISEAEAEIDYIGKITIFSSWDWIEFRLYDRGVLLDKERVPVLRNGAPAPLLYLSSTSQVFSFGSNGSPLPANQTITFKANLQNVTGTAIFHCIPYNGTNPGSEIILGGTGNERTLTAAQLGSNTRAVITATINNSTIFVADPDRLFEELSSDILADTVTVFKISDGIDALTIIQSNEAVSLKANSDGFVSDYTYGAQTIYVYEGNNAIPYDGAGTVNNSWKVTVKANGITAGSITDGGVYANIASPSNMTADNAAITFTITGKRTNGGSFNLSAEQVFSKSRQGISGENAIMIDLTNENGQIVCDYLGVPAYGLPFTSQAVLYSGLTQITEKSEYSYHSSRNIFFYPTIGQYTDPMIDGFYPIGEYAIKWSLTKAPPGVTIDGKGLITASAQSELKDVNIIQVNAKYHEETFSTILTINKVRNGTPFILDSETFNAMPKFRGVTLNADTGNTGKITLKSGGQITANAGDWVLFMGTADWTKARLYRWYQSVWTMLDPASNQLEYMEALKDITDGAPDGIFSTMFCQLLFAQQAAINTLSTQVIRLQQGGKIQSQNYQPSVQGFSIEYSGDAEFNDILIRGNSVFSGDIESGPLVLNNINSSTPDNILSYAQGDYAQNFYDYCVSRYGITFGYMATNGLYGSTGFTYFSNIYTGKNNVETRLYDKDFNLLYNFPIKDSVYSPPSPYAPKFQQSFQIGFWNSSAKTFKLNNIPTNESGLSTGTVWQDGSGYLRIKR
jgi:hypothetical protein